MTTDPLGAQMDAERAQLDALEAATERAGNWQVLYAVSGQSVMLVCHDCGDTRPFATPADATAWLAGHASRCPCADAPLEPLRRAQEALLLAGHAPGRTDATDSLVTAVEHLLSLATQQRDEIRRLKALAAQARLVPLDGGKR